MKLPTALALAVLLGGCENDQKQQSPQQPPQGQPQSARGFRFLPPLYMPDERDYDEGRLGPCESAGDNAKHNRRGLFRRHEKTE